MGRTKTVGRPRKRGRPKGSKNGAGKTKAVPPQYTTEAQVFEGIQLAYRKLITKDESRPLPTVTWTRGGSDRDYIQINDDCTPPGTLEKTILGVRGLDECLTVRNRFLTEAHLTEHGSLIGCSPEGYMEYVRKYWGFLLGKVKGVAPAKVKGKRGRPRKTTAAPTVPTAIVEVLKAAKAKGEAVEEQALYRILEGLIRKLVPGRYKEGTTVAHSGNYLEYGSSNTAMRALENAIHSKSGTTRAGFDIEPGSVSPANYDHTMLLKYWTYLAEAYVTKEGYDPDAPAPPPPTDDDLRKLLVTKLRHLVHGNNKECDPNTCPKDDRRHIGMLSTKTAIVWAWAKEINDTGKVDGKLYEFVCSCLNYHDNDLYEEVQRIYRLWQTKEIA